MTSQGGVPAVNNSAQAEAYDKFLDSVSVGSPQSVSVRKLIGLWGYKRRGSALLRMITNHLATRNLVCIPDIESADFYGDVTISDRRDLAGAKRIPLPWPISSVLDEDRQLTYVEPNTPLDQVETEMIMKAYSQIPVLASQGRELLGSVTWRSLARSQKKGSESTARDSMELGGYVADSSDNMLLHISAIVEREYIYIRGPKREIVGILTATDLGRNFLDTAGPYVKLGEIEDRIRALIDRLPLTLIATAKSPTSSQTIESAADLTFGEYVRIMEDRDNWKKMGISIDRKSAIANLREVNSIRNDVMHFRPKGLEADQLDGVDACLNWLREA